MSHCSKDSNTQVSLTDQNKSDQVNSCLMIFLKGFAMGLSDSVPGYPEQLSLYLPIFMNA